MQVERIVKNRFDLFKVYVGLTIVVFYAAGGSKMTFNRTGREFDNLENAVTNENWDYIDNAYDTAIEYSYCPQGEY